MYDIVIIGGGPAGMTAALYARRNGKSTLVLEKGGFGGQITYSPRVQNFPGTLSMSGNEFADKMLEQIMAQGADVEVTAATEIRDDLSEWVDRGGIVLSQPDSINDAVVELLMQGHVVGRFAGREEFGARSLGNRAIIADPRNPDVIREINEMVKSRDFWMPFAASVAAEHADLYLRNPKNVAAPYMILSFDTTEAGGEQLKAGTHPYDRTCRPQVVTQESNAEYWDLIHRFASRSGVGGLLNTSLNLHGLPLVHRPRDAVHVLLNSGLNWLAVGPYLITKPAA